MTQLDNLHYTIRRLWSERAAAEAEAAQWKAKAEAAEEKAELLDWLQEHKAGLEWIALPRLWIVLGHDVYGPTALDALRRAVEAMKTKGGDVQ